MTKTEAIDACVDLWYWFSKNRGTKKKDWPGWKINGGTVIQCEGNCPACEYTSLQAEANVESDSGADPCEKYCFLYAAFNDTCTHRNTPHGMFMFATNEAERHAAKKLVLQAFMEIKAENDEVNYNNAH